MEVKDHQYDTLFPLYYEKIVKPYDRMREGSLNYHNVWSLMEVMNNQCDALFNLYSDF
jgi:hypothetical protein